MLQQATVDGLSETGKASACKFYLLADTSYNPSCVDEVAAAHINAEVGQQNRIMAAACITLTWGCLN